MKNLLLYFCFLFAIIFIDCNRNFPKNDFESAGGYVIGKEVCNTDTTKDYWLLDLSINSNVYGDSMRVNGVLYKNAVKTNQLLPQFKFLGERVDCDFQISDTPVQSTNCSVSNPVTYNLRTIQILRQSEIR